jgi:signal transduction histidine kinase
VSETLRVNGIRSLLGAPMHARHRVSGVVYVASRDPRRFIPDELQLLELAADRIGAIIDNAALYEQALNAIRSRDVMMGVVSHDLRSPLSTIQLIADLLETDVPQLTRPVSIIKRSVDVMTRLISDLRDLGSIDAGRLSIVFRSEAAGPLVREAVEGMQDAAARKSVRLEARSHERELILVCDRIRIIQVLTNLLSNAIKFTPPGGAIAISVAEVEPESAQFSVEDTGIGVPGGDLVHVFDRYWQASATAHLGTGLGLAIAKGIVETHGGTMSVESRVGHGTTFSFTLPLVRGPQTDRDR